MSDQMWIRPDGSDRRDEPEVIEVPTAVHDIPRVTVDARGRLFVVHHGMQHQIATAETMAQRADRSVLASGLLPCAKTSEGNRARTRAARLTEVRLQASPRCYS